MASLDEIFYKEFTQTMLQLKGLSGVFELSSVPLPPDAAKVFSVESHDKAILSQIGEQYYSKLTGEEVRIWHGGKLYRRKYDYQGKYMVGDDGKFVVEDVVLPQDCLAVISERSIGVPTKFESKEGFQYVDMVTRTDSGGNKQVRYVYIVPRRYCYKLNQVALVLSLSKLRRYYSGVALSLKNGHVLYVYVIPYKPRNVTPGYRILHCKTSCDFTTELVMLRDYWVQSGYMFNPAECAMLEVVHGRVNMAYLPLDGVMDEYVRFNADKSMGEADGDIEYDMVDALDGGDGSPEEVG